MIKMELKSRILQLGKLGLEVKVEHLGKDCNKKGIPIALYSGGEIELITDTAIQTSNDAKNIHTKILISEIGREGFHEIFGYTPGCGLGSMKLEKHEILDQKNSTKYSFNLPSRKYLNQKP